MVDLGANLEVIWGRLGRLWDHFGLSKNNENKYDKNVTQVYGRNGWLGPKNHLNSRDQGDLTSLRTLHSCLRGTVADIYRRDDGGAGYTHKHPPNKNNTKSKCAHPT